MPPKIAEPRIGLKNTLSEADSNTIKLLFFNDLRIKKPNPDIPKSSDIEAKSDNGGFKTIASIP